MQNGRKKGEKIAKSIINGQISSLDGFSLLLQIAEGDIVEKITTLQEPPLKQSTIEARMKKRSDKNTVGNLTKPLVDTGYMLSTFTSKIS